MAVNAAVDTGLHFAVAAGNDNADACNYSPASAENAITVGASTLGDSRAYFSNYGKCTDVFAPGLNILSTWIGSEYATNTISGTSMASPHVAGLLAYFLSLQPSGDSAYATELKPAQLKKNILRIASEGVLSDIPRDTPNLLIYNGGGKDNLTEIFDGKRYSEKSNSNRITEIMDEIETMSEETFADVEKFINKLEKDVAKDVKAAFGKARDALVGLEL